MQNRYFTIGIALVLVLAGAIGRVEAKEFRSHFAGTSVDGVIDTNGDHMTASVNTGIDNNTLGRFVFQSEAEFLPPLKTNVTCPAGTLELTLLQAHAVLTKQNTTEQIFVTFTSGTECFNDTTLAFTFQGQAAFSGGTGRFVHAAGTFEEKLTGSILVFDLPAFHVLANFTGSDTGTITGVEGEDKD